MACVSHCGSPPPSPPKKAAGLLALLTFMAGWDSAASPALILGEVVPVRSAAPASSLPSLSSCLLHTPDLLITGSSHAPGVYPRRALLLRSALLPTQDLCSDLESLVPSLPPPSPALPSCLPSLCNRANRPLLNTLSTLSNGSVSSFWPGTVCSPELVLSPDSTTCFLCCWTLLEKTLSA